MGKELLLSLGSLKEALSSDSRVRELDRLETEVNADTVVKKLSEKLEALEKAYEDVLAYKKENDPVAIAAQKALYAAKEEMDANPLVARYNAAFIKVRDLYMEIDNILFSPFRKKSLAWEVR